MRSGAEIATTGGGTLRFAATSSFPMQLDIAAQQINRLGGEQSNTSIAIGTQAMLKAYRRLQPGIHPEIEVGRYLTEVAKFGAVPPLFGYLESIAADGTSTALAVLQGYVVNQGDAATVGVDGLKHDLDNWMVLADGEASMATPEARFFHYAEIIGQRTGELHTALAQPTDDPAFAPEPFTAADMTATLAAARETAQSAFAAIAARSTRSAVEEQLLARKKECLLALERLAKAPAGAVKTRVHGDYHLGQVLVAENDVVIVDFEGEPGRTSERRRAKDHPLRDVAGMLRSFAYVSATAYRSLEQRFPAVRPGASELAHNWRRHCESGFMKAYEKAAKRSPAWVKAAADRRRLLTFHLLTRALYEVVYEANNRPDWIDLPCHGVLEILDQRATP
jgi:maltose alpha-D-glucosyltransferase/alpha-amylase